MHPHRSRPGPAAGHYLSHLSLSALAVCTSLLGHDQGHGPGTVRCAPMMVGALGGGPAWQASRGVHTLPMGLCVRLVMAFAAVSLILGRPPKPGDNPDGTERCHGTAATERVRPCHVMCLCVTLSDRTAITPSVAASTLPVQRGNPVRSTTVCPPHSQSSKQCAATASVVNDESPPARTAQASNLGSPVRQPPAARCQDPGAPYCEAPSVVLRAARKPLYSGAHPPKPDHQTKLIVADRHTKQPVRGSGKLACQCVCVLRGAAQRAAGSVGWPGLTMRRRRRRPAGSRLVGPAPSLKQSGGCHVITC